MARLHLFADVSQFHSFFTKAEAQVAQLQGVADKWDSPELIDDGQHTAPSKRIALQFPEYAAAKTTIGPQMAALIGLAHIRKMCPHLDAWLTRLESLASR